MNLATLLKLPTQRKFGIHPRVHEPIFRNQIYSQRENLSPAKMNRPDNSLRPTRNEVPIPTQNEQSFTSTFVEWHWRDESNLGDKVPTERRSRRMKTDNTCVNCAVLECHVRHQCEDNELPIEPQQPEIEEETTSGTVHFVTPEISENVVDEKRFWR